MEYKILQAQGHAGRLEDAVRTEMDNGFAPIGGVCVTTHPGSGVVSYYQAVVKPDVALVGTDVTPLREPAIEEAVTIAPPADYETLKRNTRKRKGVSNAN